MGNFFKKILSLAQTAVSSPGLFWKSLNRLPYKLSALQFSSSYCESSKNSTKQAIEDNIFLNYFENHSKGNGIWKWTHYFEVYNRHFKKFVGKDLSLLEIGIYSGGSLGMWQKCFGEGCRIFGVDIESDCKKYESENVKVFIGDQADRGFWSGFRAAAGPIDILIDDGGHTPCQQRITMEEMLPHLSPGGIYLCEDVHGRWNDFGSYAASLIEELNSENGPNEFQKSVHSLHFYPFCIVIEKHSAAIDGFTAPKRGTEWQPFFNRAPL
jgi:hypothetical protein